MKAAERRLNLVVPTLLKEEVGGLFAGIAASLVWPIVRGGILDRIRAAVTADVIRRDQYVPTMKLTDTERRLLGLIYADFTTQLSKYGLARRWAEHISSKGGGPLSPDDVERALGNNNLAPFVSKIGKRRTQNLQGDHVEENVYQATEFAPGLWKRLKSMVDPPPVD
jgi:hypothetical protein